MEGQNNKEKKETKWIWIRCNYCHRNFLMPSQCADDNFLCFDCVDLLTR